MPRQEPIRKADPGFESLRWLCGPVIGVVSHRGLAERFSFPFEINVHGDRTKGVSCNECDDQAQADRSNCNRGRDPDRGPGSSLERLELWVDALPSEAGFGWPTMVRTWKS